MSRPSVQYAADSLGGGYSGRKASIRRQSQAQGHSPRYSVSQRRNSSHRRQSQHRRQSMHRKSQIRSPGPSSGHQSAADMSLGDDSPGRPQFHLDIGGENEKSVDESVKDKVTDVQAQPWVRHDEHSTSDESEMPEGQQDGEGEGFAERRLQYHSQKRASGLSVVSRTKVLRGVPTRLQVLFARQLKCVYFGPEDEEVLCRAGDSSSASNRFMVLDDGICDVLVPGPDGTEVVIGRVGPGSVIGGTLSLGLTSTHLMTIRRSRVRSKDSKLEATDERDKEEEANTRPIELITHAIHGNDIAQLEEQFKEELDVLRKRVLLDLQRFVVPHLQRLSSNGFFRRYCSAFVKRVVRNMDMRICRPSELIFKENLLAQSMAILFCGKIDFFVAGKKVATLGEPGMCFGEAALLEDNAVRSASVRCNSEADCLICLLQKEDFLHALNEFPEEKNRLEEQVKTKLTRLSMQSVFADCERNFLHFLSATADTVELAPDQPAYPDSETAEALLICQRGELVVDTPGEDERRLQKGEAIGFEAALGLRSGPPRYTLKAGENGCLLIRLSYSVLEQALIYFPGQLPAVLQVIGMTSLPSDHTFSEKQNEIWNIVRPLLCQAFMTLDIDESLCRTLAPFFKPEICDPGCTITEEGKESDEMVLLVHGVVNWSTADKVTTTAKAPRHFDEGLVMGTQRRHTATITAKSTCVLWLLSAEHVAEMKTRHWSVCKIFEEAAALRRSMQLHLQAKLRNMKTFRRFRSEILEIISRNMDIRTFLPKEVIFAAGEEGDCMYILLQGKAEATVNGRIGQLEEGSTFGEMCLFGQVKRTMTVSSASLCICNVVHRDIITYAFTQFPDDKNANRDAGGPPPSRGLSVIGGRAKASEEKLFSKKGSKRESRAQMISNMRDKKGASRISLRTLDACCRQNLVSPPPGDASSPRNANNRRSTKGKDVRSSKLLTSSGSNSNIMSRSSIKAAERKSTRATFFKNNSILDEEAFSTSTESDSSDGDHGRHQVVKLGRTSWIKGGGTSARSSMNNQEDQHASSQARNTRKSELDSTFTDGELTRDEEEEEAEPGPQELLRRFQHRSCLFDVPTPKVPPADETLYSVGKEAEEKLSRAFRSYMPGVAAVTSSRVHGVPSASRQRDKNGLFTGIGMHESTMSIGSGRPFHIGATYTSPLPPIQHTRPPGSAIVTGARPKDGERNIALAGNLQMLASSLLRINNKPTLTNLTLEELQKSAAVEDKGLRSGIRELYHDNPSRATWSDSDESDDARGYWNQKRSQVSSRELSYISADSMRAITAPMASRSEKHAHLKRSYLAMPMTPSMPKKPGKQRPRPQVRTSSYSDEYLYEEVPSTVGRRALGEDEPKEMEEVVEWEDDHGFRTKDDRDMEDVQEEEEEMQPEAQRYEAIEAELPGPDERTTRRQVCFFIRKFIFQKVAPRMSDVPSSQPPLLPIARVTDKGAFSEEQPESKKAQDASDSSAAAVSRDERGEQDYEEEYEQEFEDFADDYEDDESATTRSAKAQAGDEQRRSTSDSELQRATIESQGEQRRQAEAEQRRSEDGDDQQQCRVEPEVAVGQSRAEEWLGTGPEDKEEKLENCSADHSPTAAPDVAESTGWTENTKLVEQEAREAVAVDISEPDLKAELPEATATESTVEQSPSFESEEMATAPCDEKLIVATQQIATSRPADEACTSEEAHVEEDMVSLMAATMSFITFVVVRVANKMEMQKKSSAAVAATKDDQEVRASASAKPCETTVSLSRRLEEPTSPSGVESHLQRPIWLQPSVMTWMNPLPIGQQRAATTTPHCRSASGDATEVPAEILASAAAGDYSRPVSRKKAPKQEALEGEPLLPQEAEPPKPAADRPSVRNSRRVRVTNPAEERAERAACGFMLRHACYRQISRKMRKEDSIVNNFMRRHWIKQCSLLAGSRPEELP